MKASEVMASLGLPADSRMNRRVPKKLLIENGAPTAADKRRISEGIEELFWLAALKPATVGVPEYRDAAREYLEIAVLSLTLRPEVQPGRLMLLVHRAIPYPVILLSTQSDAVTLSLAHKRWSQGETGKTVLDGELVAVGLDAPLEADILRNFLEALSLARQPRTNLYALYQGWVDTVLGFQAACITGIFSAPASAEHAALRRESLEELNRLEARIAAVQATAEKEKQLARRVELNLELVRLKNARKAARAKL
jgi:hypothetical protein